MTDDRSRLRCPICRARFRGTRQCSRCGADLARLMKLAVGAWHARQVAWRAWLAGERQRAASWAAKAQQLCVTSAGDRLERLTASYFSAP